MMVDLWECMEPVHHDALEVCAHIKEVTTRVARSIPSVWKNLERVPENERVNVVLAMGGDLLFRMQELSEVIEKHFVVVMKRDEKENLDSVVYKLKNQEENQKESGGSDRGKEQRVQPNRSSCEDDPASKIIILPDKYSNQQIQNLSSTLVRNNLAQEKSIQGLVPTPVVEYIENHRLWQGDTDADL